MFLLHMYLSLYVLEEKTGSHTKEINRDLGKINAIWEHLSTRLYGYNNKTSSAPLNQAFILLHRFFQILFPKYMSKRKINSYRILKGIILIQGYYFAFNLQNTRNEVIPQGKTFLFYSKTVSHFSPFSSNNLMVIVFQTWIYTIHIQSLFLHRSLQHK